MHAVDTPGATIDGQFQAGNPIAGVVSTIMGADWPNAIQQEIIEVIEAEGFGLDKTNNAQLRIAIQSMIDQGSSPVGWLNVRTGFFARGNGTQDDTVPIQNAIDSAFAAGGGTVYMPRGHYRTTATIILKSGVTLIGDGRLSILDLDGDHNGIDTESSSSGIRLTNFAFAGRAAGTPVTIRAALRITVGSSQIMADHLWFDDVVNGAIALTGVSAMTDIQLDSIYINGTGEHGIYVGGGATRVQISNVIGINIGGVAGGVGNGNGLWIDESSDVQCHNVWMDAAASGGSHGIRVGPSTAAGTVSNVSLFNCRGRSNSGIVSHDGLLIQNDAQDVQVFGGDYRGAKGVRVMGLSGSDRPFRVLLLGVRGESLTGGGTFGLRVTWGNEVYVQGGIWLQLGTAQPCIRVDATAEHVFLDGIFTGSTTDDSHAVDILNSTTYVDRVHHRGAGILSSEPIRITPSTEQRQIATLPVDDTTPSVLGLKLLRTANSFVTLITNFDDGQIGQEIHVLVDDANTRLDFTASNLRGNNGVDWVVPEGESFRATYDGTNWYVDKRA